MPSPYSARYYEGLRDDSERSARVVVPLLLGLLPAARSVVDVGCGAGFWTRVYRERGLEVLGVDGDIVRDTQLLIPREDFQRHDLTLPLRLTRRFDLVNCLEVAEHLPAGRADSFVDDLAALGDVVVFSAAVPGQGGTHHVNEQWPRYWIERFTRAGFVAVDCLRHRIWDEPEVAWWYCQNLFVFVRKERVADHAALMAEARPLPVDLVHPRGYMKAALPREMSPRMLAEVLRALPTFPGKIYRHFRR